MKAELVSMVSPMRISSPMVMIAASIVGTKIRRVGRNEIPNNKSEIPNKFKYQNMKRRRWLAPVSTRGVESSLTLALSQWEREQELNLIEKTGGNKLVAKYLQFRGTNTVVMLKRILVF